jgi:hypothetical protein
MDLEPTVNTTSTKPPIRVSIACVQCRSKHLRCDAAVPACSRCRSDGSQCTYLKSRRGGRRTAGTSQNNSTAGQTEASEGNTLERTAPDPHKTDVTATPAVASISSTISGSSSPLSVVTIYPSIFDDTDCGTPLFDLYYMYFHTSHPCVLPLRYMKQKLKENWPGTKLLAHVMEYIASVYLQSVSSASFEKQVIMQLAELKPYTNGFEVQALLLYSIALYWNDGDERATQLLNLAIDKALLLGMNQQSYANANSNGEPVLAESWRRTWWLLYIAEAHVAGINHWVSFRLSIHNTAATVELPCEESDYGFGVRILHNNRSTLHQFAHF